MKVKVIESFQYEGKEFQEGKVIDLPDSVGRSVIEKGYGEEVEVPEVGPVEKVTDEENIEVEGSKGPEWKRKIWVSEDRNLAISLWPPGGKFDSPSVTLEENRRDDTGNWESNRIYLPKGSNLVALSEHIKSAWNELQRMKSD